MSARYYQMDDPLPGRELWAVPVPWHLVALLATYPDATQLVATLYVDPKKRKAAAVLWPGVDPRWIATLLNGMQREYQLQNPTPVTPAPETYRVVEEPAGRKKSAKRPGARTTQGTPKAAKTAKTAKPTSRTAKGAKAARR